MKQHTRTQTNNNTHNTEKILDQSKMPNVKKKLSSERIHSTAHALRIALVIFSPHKNLNNYNRYYNYRSYYARHKGYYHNKSGLFF